MPVTVDTSLTTLTVIPARFARQMSFQLKNTGDTALNAFQVQARLSVEADWLPIKTADFVGEPSETYPVWASANPVTLADGAGAIIHVAGVYGEVRLQASVASGTTTIEVYSLGQG
jgi:hypothetical protein